MLKKWVVEDTMLSFWSIPPRAKKKLFVSDDSPQKESCLKSVQKGFPKISLKKIKGLSQK